MRPKIFVQHKSQIKEHIWAKIIPTFLGVTHRFYESLK